MPRGRCPFLHMLDFLAVIALVTLGVNLVHSRSWPAVAVTINVRPKVVPPLSSVESIQPTSEPVSLLAGTVTDQARVQFVAEMSRPKPAGEGSAQGQVHAT